jgi:hypothetical protein
MHMDIQDPVRQCYERQKGNMRVESWVKNMKEELESIGLVHLAQSAGKGHQESRNDY